MFVCQKHALLGFVRMYPLFKIWTPGQCICLVIGARFVNKSEVEFGKEQGPACLVARELLFGVEVDEVIVVCPDFKGFGVAFKIAAEGFEGMNNGKEFFIMNIVILFSGEEGLGEVSDRAPAIKKVRLFENSTHGKVACISDEAEGTHAVGEHEDWGCGKGMDKCVEGSLDVRSPCEGCVFLG
jgi:hypothetical protein